MREVPHLKLNDDLQIHYAILPGDPARVERVAKYLEQVRELSFNREFRSISGFYKGIEILVTSTGLGGPSAALAIEELSQIGVKTAIRIGSCGALDSSIEVGDLILAQAAVRDEGTSKAYIGKQYPAIADFSVLSACDKAADFLQYPKHLGIVRCHDSLYSEQKKVADDYYSTKHVLGSDMETAAVFVVGTLRGMKTASILNCVVAYGEKLAENINSYVDGEKAMMLGEEREILTALEACYLLENNL